MASTHETIALNVLGDAIEILRHQYRVPGDAENRRDQIKAFLQLVFRGVERLTTEAEGDAAYVSYTLPSVMEDIDTAFLDQIEREDAATPRTRPYSTLNNRTQGTGRAYVEAVR